MFALSSGHCLKESDPTECNWRHPINYQVLAPYESLMFHTFGGGNQTFFGPPARSHGLMSDAYTFGGRFDYSVAANLNLWTSYIWAHRLEKYDTLFGQYASTGRQATPAERRAFAQEAGRSLVAWPDNYGYVSDGFVGQEINIGADWRLTDSLNLSLRWGCWKPGKWFSEAHQAQTVTAAGLTTFTGVMEKRPAIHGFHGSFVVKF